MADEQKGTEYKVLVPYVSTTSDTDVTDALADGIWRELDGTFMAASDIAAIKVAAKEHGAALAHGAVAVPARSWRPRKPQKKVQETTLWT